MKKVTKSVIAAAVLAATSASAMAEVSMNVGATTNYIWRGVTQTSDNAAMSGGMDYAHDSGFYAGAWLSSLNGSTGSALGAEFDYYAGYAGSAAGVDYDVNLTAITYPQIEDANFTELGASVTYSYFTLGLNSTIASDVVDVNGQADAFVEGDLYTYLSASIPMANDYSVGLTFGSYSFDQDGVGGGDLNYTHYQLSVTKSAGDFGEVTMAYDATDMDDDPTTAYLEDSARFSVSLTKSF
ncbi:MAG: TorF family putative porin [Chromatiales bacterium]|nr:TorF family putative porin [Chromatiales bacterium]